MVFEVEYLFLRIHDLCVSVSLQMRKENNKLVSSSFKPSVELEKVVPEIT